MITHMADKRVLITGGSTGIGAAMSRAFASEGAKVAINYVVNPDIAIALCRSLQEQSGDVLTVQADVSDAHQVEAMFATLDNQWGGVDVLVNNAGIDGVRARAWESDPHDWVKTISVNLTGAFLCARQALKRMVNARRGVILNVSSVHEIIAWTGYSAYVTSKAGLGMMSKTLAQEAAPYNVRVLCIAPGAVRTPINKTVWDDPASYADLTQKIPLGRIAEPEEIARLAVVLASDIASYVTGTTVFADGGMTDFPDFAHGG